ncbi:hypothetical protein K4B79_12020 [Streptomyces lincolnensis]|uniref:hypothetical protein n=1 Tax=Streptomyces lincolnensis TaxID=1915 RepID=UPI001E5098DB|nr:hypothetical protein [Streptomyces lincolnensis]MCD7438950.1 hypothetical protein [Streptomyces lincolnensis]
MGLKPRELWSRFEWQRGNCFKCDGTDLPVAEIGEIQSADYVFRLLACHQCVFRLEQLHWAMRERAVRRQNELSAPPEQEPAVRHRIPGALLSVRQIRALGQQPDQRAAAS